MPITHLICKDDESILIEECLAKKGCRMGERCAPLPYLRIVGHDRGWRGITPSMAGNGPRMIYLKRTTDYAVKPDAMAWALFGIATHEKLSLHDFTFDVLSEEELADDKVKGIADVLEEDEYNDGFYILTDYKTYGSYSVAKALGIYQKEEPVLVDGEPVRFKSGPRKGKPKTKKVTYVDPNKADNRVAEFQLNRYRMLFEAYGFPVSEMRLFYISRDGGTYIAKSRGIKDNIGFIPINRLSDGAVLGRYEHLAVCVEEAMESGFARRCNAFESWDGVRCDRYCEVSKPCERMGK